MNEDATKFNEFLETLGITEDDIQEASKGGVDDKEFSHAQELKIELIEISLTEDNSSIEFSNDQQAKK